MNRFLLIFVLFNTAISAMDRYYAHALAEHSAQQKQLLLGQELLGIVIGIARTPRSEKFVIAENIMNNIKSLLTQEANVNAITADNKKTAIHYAVEIPNIEIIKLFIMYGADLNKKDILGNTPLQDIGWLDTAHVLEFAKLLIENGADVNTQNVFDSETPLMNAVRWKNVPLVKLLVDGVNAKGIANLGDRDKTYYSLLPAELRKAIFEHLKIRANPNIKNKNDETALDLAKRFLRLAQHEQNNPESFRKNIDFNQ